MTKIARMYLNVILLIQYSDNGAPQRLANCKDKTLCMDKFAYLTDNTEEYYDNGGYAFDLMVFKAHPVSYVAHNSAFKTHNLYQKTQSMWTIHYGDC